MSRRSIILATGLLLASATTALIATPAQAIEANPVPVSTTAKPCPLTEAQLASGRLVIASAQQTIVRGNSLLDAQTTSSRPTPTPVANPITLDDAATCALAVSDLNSKTNKAKQALDQLAICLAGSILTGASCNAESNNADAALRDVEIALNNLKYACPWFVF